MCRPSLFWPKRSIQEILPSQTGHFLLLFQLLSPTLTTFPHLFLANAFTSASFPTKNKPSRLYGAKTMVAATFRHWDMWLSSVSLCAALLCFATAPDKKRKTIFFQLTQPAGRRNSPPPFWFRAAIFCRVSAAVQILARNENSSSDPCVLFLHWANRRAGSLFQTRSPGAGWRRALFLFYLSCRRRRRFYFCVITLTGCGGAQLLTRLCWTQLDIKCRYTKVE